MIGVPLLALCHVLLFTITGSKRRLYLVHLLDIINRIPHSLHHVSLVLPVLHAMSSALFQAPRQGHGLPESALGCGVQALRRYLRHPKARATAGKGSCSAPLLSL